ncbi:glutathione synthase [Entomortierella parvispora]|uniref:Glutathione synthetase n=1 Tax=Entomortierella parvispora TaxID=205924 RepID=A0A9P3H2D5_9FUNG|nr:glutathione synthase [Entomortierella parvispora]
MSDLATSVTDDQLLILKDAALDYALSHGLVVRPPATAASHTGVVNAPVSLFPTPFPAKAFQDAVKIQPLFNQLVHDISEDDAFLKEIMESLSTVDDFVKRLYDLYLLVKKEGIAQPASLGVHRSDYIIHLSPGQDFSEAAIKQVEMNTISVSFGSLSSLTGDLHRYLQATTGYFTDKLDVSALPSSESIESIASGLASAHQHYGSKTAKVMMVVQPGERNAFDQRYIEYNLLKNHGIVLIRKTLAEVADHGRLDPQTKALYIGDQEISVAYYRSAYATTDYPTEKEWEGRLLAERSLAIKCPTVAYQLVGTKKVQQVLAAPGQLERFVQDPVSVAALRASFTGLYPLDHTSEGLAAYEAALKNSDELVMKPQREGGGNNIYGKDIQTTLKTLTPEQRNAYILMDIIRPPVTKNVLLRQGELQKADVVSELGVYGIYLHDGKRVVRNDNGGHLLRTKGVESNEGGVAAGFAVIDSVLLV